MVNSRDKGKRGERELAHFLADNGFPARRGQQFHGGADSPDVVCDALSDLHLEVKRVERGSIYDWFAQAERECGDKIPVVAHRKNNQPWLVIMGLDEFLAMRKRLAANDHHHPE